MLEEARANKLQLDQLKRSGFHTAAGHVVVVAAAAAAATAPAVRATRRGLRRRWRGGAEAAEEGEGVVLARLHVHGVERAAGVTARVLSAGEAAKVVVARERRCRQRHSAEVDSARQQPAADGPRRAPAQSGARDPLREAADAQSQTRKPAAYIARTARGRTGPRAESSCTSCALRRSARAPRAAHPRR